MDRGHGGFLLAIAPAFFGAIGWLLDGWLGWTPVLTIVGAAYGLVGALVKLMIDYRTEMAVASEARRAALRTPGGVAS